MRQATARRGRNFHPYLVAEQSVDEVIHDGPDLGFFGLEDVVLVGNDTGGAIAQIVATTAPQRLGALVLTNCDASDHFPPPILKPFVAAAKFSPAFTAAAQPLRTKLGRQRAFGALAHADIDQLVVEWLRPALTDPRIREDLQRFTASLKAESTINAVAGLR